MHAQVVINKLQAGKADDWLDLLRDAVVPSLKEQRGFHGFVALVDRSGDRSIGHSVWETEEDMIASEASGNYRDQIAKLGSVLAGPPNRDGYELVVIS